MVVKRGETGTYVKWLQQGLHIMCCYDGTIDSTFGAGTESGVKKYQGKNGLEQDGMAGPATWNCLMSDIQAIQTALKVKVTTNMAVFQAMQMMKLTTAYLNFREIIISIKMEEFVL